MENSELFWFIFFDEFMSSLLLSLKEKYVLSAAITLRKGFEIYTGFFFAFCGGVTGTLVNYVFARICSKGFNLNFNIDNKIQVTLLCSLLFLPISYFGSVVSCLYGLARLGFARLLIITIIVYGGYFGANLVLYKLKGYLFLL